MTRSSEKTQKDINVLIDLISKSPMTARQKELSLDKIKSICDFVTILEVEKTKLDAKRQGFKNSGEFINFTDRLFAYSEMLGVHEVDIELLKPEHYEFIQRNYPRLKQPINYVTIRQVMHGLILYHTFNNSYPVTTQDLWNWLKENEYEEMIKELNKDVLKKLEIINETI